MDPDRKPPEKMRGLSPQQIRYDEALNQGRLPQYEAQTEIASRKRVGARHRKRKAARASRKKNR
jgi:hypothetical protein